MLPHREKSTDTVNAGL